jgi:hypothetical protein
MDDRTIAVKLVRNELVPRSLPAKYAGLRDLFIAEPRPAAGAFRFKETPAKWANGQGVCRELGLMLCKSLGGSVRGLVLRVTECATDDKHIILDQLERRFADLPVKPDVQEGAEFALRADNLTGRTRAVMTGEVQKPDGWKVLPFPAAAELINLRPGCFLHLRLRVDAAVAGRGGGEGGGNPGGVVAVRPRSVPVDHGAQNPLNAEVLEVELKFDTHGYIMPLPVLQRAVSAALFSVRQLDTGNVQPEEKPGVYVMGADTATAPGVALVLARLLFLRLGSDLEFVAASTDPVSLVQILRVAGTSANRGGQWDAATVKARLAEQKTELIRLLEGILKQLVALE